MVVESVADTSKYLEGVKEALDVDSINNIHFYDIHFVKDGEEIEVKGNVTVTVTLSDDDAMYTDSTVNVLHFPDESCKAEVLGEVSVEGGKQPEEESSTEATVQTQSISPKRLLKRSAAKKTSKNSSVFPKYYVENAQEPIVPRGVFMQVQSEFLRREGVKELTGKTELHYGNLALNSRIVCSECGNTYKRVTVPKDEYTSWRCRTR